MKEVVYRLGGFACPDCAQQLGLIMERQKGVEQAKVTYATGKLKVKYNPEQIGLEDIEKIIAKTGYQVLDKR